MGIFDWLSRKRKQSKKEVVDQNKSKDDMPESIDSSFKGRKMLKRDMKLNNETIREAVEEWLDDEELAESKYGHISSWDTSKVTNMSSLFLNAHEFNSPIDKWDVSNVTTMNAMFDNAYNFNQPIGDWDVSKVEDMGEMFSSSETLKFNQSIGDWDVSNVTNMEYMFASAESFNQPIGDWDVSNVTVMNAMFAKAKSFNQPIGDWNVSNVEDMSQMFLSAESFNQPIGNWDVSNVTVMNAMFAKAKSFNQPIGNWDVSNVTVMNAMFAKAKSFNQPIGDWNVSNVTNMEHMFTKAKSFNQPIGDWDVANVTSMHDYDLISKHRDLGEKIDLIDSIINELTDSEENDRFLSSWSTQELRGIHNLFKAIIFEAYPMTDEKHKARLRAMIGFFQMAYCSNQNTYLFVDDKDYQNFVKEIQLDKILPSKEGIDSLRDLNKRKKNELLFMATILITQSDVGWDEVFETKEFNLIRKLLAIYQWDENSYNKMYNIYCEEDDKRLNSL